MRLDEIVMLNEEKKVIVYGPFLKKFNPKLVPQYLKTKRDADVVESYNELGTPVKVQLVFKKAASNDVVEETVKEAGIDIDLGEFSYAQAVSTLPELRKALKKKGFDAYAGLSVIENFEPMQYVVFDVSQVTQVEKKVNEAKEVMDDWAKPMFEIIRKIDSKIDGGLGGMGSSDGAWTSEANAKKIESELKKAGYKVSKENDGSITIYHDDSEDRGVSLSQPEDDEEELKGKICVTFFDWHKSHPLNPKNK